MSAPPEPAPQAEPGGRLLLGGWLVVAVCELALAFAVHTYSSIGFCPSIGAGASCSALIRPRLAALGPVSISQVALVGATLSVCFGLLAVLNKLSPRLKTFGAGALAVGAGFALSLQALPYQVSGSVCPLCAGLAAMSFVVAVGLGHHALRVDKRILGAAFAAAMVLTLPLALWRASALKTQDAERRHALAEVGGERGPQLVLVTRDGCPYCEAFELDALGDPAVLELLAQTRGVRFVAPHSLEAKALKDIPGAPTLVALGPDRKELGRVVGLKPAEFLEGWLRSLLPK